MFDAINSVVTAVNGVVWGWPMIILLLGTHIFMTFRTGFIQRHSIGKGIRRHIQDSHNVCMICCIKILSTYDHIIISIFFSSSFQLHFFSAMQERHILERLSLS